MPSSFNEVTLDLLDTATASDLDELSFGVIGFDRDGLIETYNAMEAKLAGLSQEKVIGRHLFEAVAPCMNNFMIAQRFEDEPALDEIVDYVLTFRMRPQPVSLRLLQQPARGRRYIAIVRRT
ncbi:MAG: PAS domain-containing protein [Janthinobacterium lividum]